MKKANKVGIIVWSIVAIVLVVVLVFGIVGGGRMNIFGINFNMGIVTDENAKFSSITEVPVSGIKGIDVSWSSANVKFFEYDGKTIQLNERSKEELSDDDKLVYNIENDVLKIEEHRKEIGFHFWGNGGKILEVKIPKTVVANIENVNINCSSADVFVKELSLKDIDVNTSSGNTSLDKCEFANGTFNTSSGDIKLSLTNLNGVLSCETSSGNIKLKNVNANGGNLNTVSGDITVNSANIKNEILAGSTSGEIKVNSFTTEKADISSVSGDIELEGSLKNIKLETTSGEINLNTAKFPSSLKANSVSGDINIEIPADEKTGFTASVSKVSGEFSSSFPIIDKGDKKIYGNGKSIFEFGTVSGDISINND